MRVKERFKGFKDGFKRGSSSIFDAKLAPRNGTHELFEIPKLFRALQGRFSSRVRLLVLIDLQEGHMDGI